MTIGVGYFVGYQFFRHKKRACNFSQTLDFIMEAAPGFEPGISALQAVALPLGQAAVGGAGNGI